MKILNRSFLLHVRQDDFVECDWKYAYKYKWLIHMYFSIVKLINNNMTT
jgi:hypothetical protein